MGKYTKILRAASAGSDFTVTDHQALPSITEFQTIATYKCPAQTKIAVGYGTPTQPDSAGHIYVFLKTGEATPVEILGKLRVIVTNFAGTKQVVLAEHDESVLHGSQTDRKLMLQLAEKRPMIKQDDYIKVQIMPAAAHVAAGATADNVGWGAATESLIQLPITVYD